MKKNKFYFKYFFKIIFLFYVHFKFLFFLVINKKFFFKKNLFYLKCKYENGVSICITAFKSVKFIKDTLNSIANQTWFKNHNNYEIILGIDGCNETLNYIKTIKNSYKNLKIIMMKENKGTYVTTNTIMTISKFDNIIRFDSDDIMFPNLVEKIMNQNEKYNMIRFKMKNFNIKTNETYLENAHGQFLIKHWIFDYFGGFLPWKCSADEEFIIRVKKFIKILFLNETLFLRKIHPESLTQSNKTNSFSLERRSKFIYIEKITKNIKTLKEARIEKVMNKYYEVK